MVGLIGAMIILLAGVGTAQQVDMKWLLGKWQGEQWTGTGQSKSSVEIVFREEAGKIQWDLEVTTGRKFTSKASGAATVSENSVALQGEYHSGRASGPLSYSLTRQGNDELTGTGIGSAQASFQVAWRKVK